MIKHRRFFYILLAALPLLAANCRVPQQINVLQDNSSPTSKLNNAIFRVIVEHGYGDTVNIVEGSADNAQELLRTGKVDVVFELPHTDALYPEIKTFDSLFEGEPTVKGINVALIKKAPQIVTLVEKMSIPAERKKRAITRALRRFEEDISSASYYVFDNMRTAWNAWVPENVRQDVTEHVAQALKDLKAKGVDI